MKLLACLWILLVISYIDSCNGFMRTKQACDEARIERGTRYNHFMRFISKYRKLYRSTGECAKRYEIFRSSLDKIRLMNKKSKSARYGITKFADMTEQEVKKHLGLIRPRRRSRINTVKAPFRAQVPLIFDWRDFGVVNPVVDQGNCGCCYSLSTVANIEGAFAVKYGELYQISAQQIIDCDNFNNGCDGGWPANAMIYMTYFGGMEESDYPFEAVKGNCSYDKKKVQLKADSFVKISTNEDDIRTFLVLIGPLSAVIYTKYLVFYKEGIIDEDDCQGDVDHAVTIVGFGTEKVDKKDVPYWIVKNTWGDRFGEKGYFRIARNKGMCNINYGVESVLFF